MKTSEAFFSDLEVFRTPLQMKEYFERKKLEIIENSEETKLARLKKGRFKEFLEEFYPLYLFSQSNYVPNDAEVRIVIGNQPYDGLIKLQSGMTKKIEFTEYIEGYLDRQDAELLNERGYSKPRFCDTKDLQVRADDFLEKIVENANKKANKNYEGVSIVFVINTFFNLDIWELDRSKFINTLIDRLRELPFKCEAVYILALNNDPIELIDRNICKVL